MDAVYVDMAFEDETWGVSPPMPRWVAEFLCNDFAMGTPYINGKRVVVAQIVPWSEWQ
jgi:hypothetical protein